MKDTFNRWVLAALMALSGLVLGGCKAETKETTSEYVLPAELQDCKIYLLTSDEGNGLYITRCPNSSTATNYKSGKTSLTTLTIDGVQYVAVPASGASQ